MRYQDDHPLDDLNHNHHLGMNVINEILCRIMEDLTYLGMWEMNHMSLMDIYYLSTFSILIIDQLNLN